MKQNIQKNVARLLLWSLLLQAFMPAATFAAQTKACCPSKKVVNACLVKTDKLCVKNDANIGGNLTVGEDVVIDGDLTVKGTIHGNCPPQCDRVADYIVVGVGSAGGVIASRLSDDMQTSVIGIEAGDNNNKDELIFNPFLNFFLQTDYITQYFYAGFGSPQQQLPNSPSVSWICARLLGGGTSVNDLLVVKASAKYWQSVADIVGNDWSVDKVFARYKALESFVGPRGPGPDTRGTNGPWQNVALPANPTPDATYILNGFEAASQLPAIVDYNNPLTPLGPFARSDMQERFTDDFLRESSAFAFLGSDVMTPDGIGVNGRKLRVHLNSTAIDLLWNGNKVIGIRYTQNGQAFEVFATKEVIISAGLHSAPLLQLNGIGPKAVLDKAQVPVRVDSPFIGALKNQTSLFIFFEAPDLVLTDSTLPYSYDGPGAFLPALPGGDKREIQWAILDGLTAPNVLLLGVLGVLQPKSTGSVTILNSDPLKQILVDQAYFSDTDGPDNTSADMQLLVEGIQNFVLPLNDYFTNNANPRNGAHYALIQPSVEIVQSSSLLQEYILANFGQTYHWATQVPMGSDASNGAVDSHGRVFGVSGLRVADDSILPIITDGNTGTPAILIGWTISEFILAGQ